MSVQRINYKITYNVYFADGTFKLGLTKTVSIIEGFNRKDDVQKQLAVDWQVDRWGIVITDVEEI